MPGRLIQDMGKRPEGARGNANTRDEAPTNLQGRNHDERLLAQHLAARNNATRNIAIADQVVPPFGFPDYQPRPEPAEPQRVSHRLPQRVSQHVAQLVPQRPQASAAWLAAGAEAAKAAEEDKWARLRRNHVALATNSNAVGEPLRFYGPGPDGRLKGSDPTTGTLHFARWRHEAANIDDPDGADYYHEDPRLKDQNGLHTRPSYAMTGQAVEVNYFRWARVPAALFEGVKVFPGHGATRLDHDEYILNESDFNQPNTRERGLAFGLSNRCDEEISKIYPKGYKLLKKMSKKNSTFGEWMEGQCLGPNPFNPNGLTKHIGWIPFRLRYPSAGLGADPLDAIWCQVFHGILDTQPLKKFVKPKDSFREDESKVLLMTSSWDPNNIMYVVSHPALVISLPPYAPETINVRNEWLQNNSLVRDVKLIEPKTEKRALEQSLAVTRVRRVDVINLDMASLSIGKEEKDDEEDKENKPSKHEGQEPSRYGRFRDRFLNNSGDGW